MKHIIILLICLPITFAEVKLDEYRAALSARAITYDEYINLRNDILELENLKNITKD